MTKKYRKENSPKYRITNVTKDNLGYGVVMEDRISGTIYTKSVDKKTYEIVKELIIEKP